MKNAVWNNWYNEHTYIWSYSILDNIFQHDNAKDPTESIQVSHKDTKRGPPTNKNISVRNIKAQIANMSCNENAGFKSEYQVRTSTLIILFTWCWTLL